MRLNKLIILTVLAGLVVAACSSANASGPPDIKYGRDICVQCGMIVSEEKFAAAYTHESGESRSFDDLGDLILYTRESGETIDPLKGWVHDYQTGEWIDLKHAFFVPTLSVSTPMGHSIISFSDETRAAAFASEVDGEVIGWDVVIALPAVDNLVGHHHMDMDEGIPDEHDHDHDEDHGHDDHETDG